MEDFGRNFADEAAEMVSEAVGNAGSELRKRRSTRIVQAVPLVVTGVDALGRPFVERTSSLIINCHGCRYQSKHYVLKNMWVNLEVPHSEADQPPRTVRGRVAWIQRPRTVRQLFQVALELENPGNVWGIGFPPEDWSAVPEPPRAFAAAAGAASQEAPLPQEYPSADSHASHHPESAAQGHATSPSPAHDVEFHVSLNETDAATASAPDNLRVFPSLSSTTDASLHLARQVTRLLADAKQQLQTAAREAASTAVAAERRIDAEQWEQKLAAARQEFSLEVAGALEKIQLESESRGQLAQNAAAEALRNDLPRWLAPQLEELTRDLTAQLLHEAMTQRNEHVLQLNGAVESLRSLCQQAEDSAAHLRRQVEQSEALLASRAETAAQTFEQAVRQREESLASQRSSLLATANEIQQQMNSVLAAAETNWQNHLNGELEAAQLRWQIAVDNALATAHERSRAGLNEQSTALLTEFRQEIERVTAAFKETTAQALSESEQRWNTLRDPAREQAERIEAALSRAAETSERLDHLSARIDTVQQHALTGFQSQADDVLNLHRNELHRRSESMFEEINARIRATFEESSRLAVSQFDQQISSLVQPHISRADEAIHRLAGGRSLLDAALTLQQDRIRASADEAFSEALAQFRSNLGGVEQLLQESSEVVTARNLTELETKAEIVKHQAVEDLLKAAEWYEKKAQTQIQTLAEKATEHAGMQLREKAGEIANMFAGDLDTSSRNFLGHTQRQMDDLVRDSFDRARALFAEAADTTSAAFIDEIQRNARQELDGFNSELQKSANEARIQMETAHTELTQKLTAEQEDFLRRFQSALGGVVDSGVAEAQHRVEAGFEPLLESWKSMTDAHQHELRVIYSAIGDQAAEHHRTRLENVSNQWMLATVASLDRQSRDVVAGIAAAAEEKLRETCTQVFADIGESLRQRLQQIASSLEIPSAPAR